MIAAPIALLLPRRQLQCLLEDERLPAINELHAAARRGRIDGDAALCGEYKNIDQISWVYKTYMVQYIDNRVDQKVGFSATINIFLYIFIYIKA